jgi:hypothetical protein
MVHLPKRLSAVLAAAALAGLLAACSINQTIAVKADGSGTAAMRVQTTKQFREYVLSIEEVSGQSELAKQGKIFDVAAIQKDLAARPGITVKRVASPNPDLLEVELGFRSIQEVYSSTDPKVASTGVLRYSESGGRKSLKIHLDRKNFAQLSDVFPGLSGPVFQGLAPQENDQTTEADYLDMIQFSLGPDGPALLKQSFIDLVVKPEGQILDQTGGTVAGGAVTFHIPLLRVLVLDKPLDYSVTWK